MKKINIAIDGPSGAGKSTIARRVAAEMGLIYIDTGALYRTVGLYVCRQGIDSKDTEKIIAALPQIHVDLAYQDGVQRVMLNGEDVSDSIRINEISKYASDVSAIPQVRAALLSIQKEMAEKYSVIMDGRDIGTVILPHAEVKIFLTASMEDRAMRRFEELKAKGQQVTYEEVLAGMKERDENDSSRDVAPLKPAEDAIMVDTSGNTLEQSVALIQSIIKERI